MPYGSLPNNAKNEAPNEYLNLFVVCRVKLYARHKKQGCIIIIGRNIIPTVIIKIATGKILILNKIDHYRQANT